MKRIFTMSLKCQLIFVIKLHDLFLIICSTSDGLKSKSNIINKVCITTYVFVLDPGKQNILGWNKCLDKFSVKHIFGLQIKDLVGSRIAKNGCNLWIIKNTFKRKSKSWQRTCRGLINSSPGHLKKSLARLSLVFLTLRFCFFYLL